MQRLSDYPVLFDERHIESALDQAPRMLAATLARLSGSAAAGEWSEPQQALVEVAALYLYAADRIAAEFFALLDADPATRDLFFQETAAETGRLLREQFQRPAGGSFADLLDERRSEYGRCRAMVRTHAESLDGTVMFAFYKHLLAFGRNTAVGVMSQLQLEEVENEVANAFAEAVGRVSLAEGAEVADAN